MFAELYITSPESITEAFFDGMKSHFTEAEMVEMMFFVGFCNLLQRFNTAIELEPADGENIVKFELSRS